MAETEEKLYELIKKGEVDFSDPCWETCHESGKILFSNVATYWIILE